LLRAREILDRFKNHAGGIKLLITTALSVLTKKARQPLRSHNIHIITTGKLIGKNDFPRKGCNSSLFWQIKQEISNLIQNARKKVLGVLQSRLDSVVVNTNSNDYKPILKNSLLTHDTDQQIRQVEQAIEQQENRVETIVEGYLEFGKGPKLFCRLTRIL